MYEARLACSRFAPIAAIRASGTVSPKRTFAGAAANGGQNQVSVVQNSQHFCHKSGHGEGLRHDVSAALEQADGRVFAVARNEKHLHPGRWPRTAFAT